MNSETKLEVENGLLNILNYEHYELVKTLLENREIIYYCTKYHQTKNEKEKESILEEMKLRDISIYGQSKPERERQSVSE